MNTEYTDYPFTSDGVNFIARIYSGTEIAELVKNVPAEIFQMMNDQTVQQVIGEASNFSPAELLSELERVNEGGTSAFILLGAN